MKKYLTILLIYFIVCAIDLNAQTLPPIQIYNPENYNGDNQNWQISQSDDNFIYVANNKRLLEFDGAEWQLYPTPNNTILRSVKAIGEKIYTGCYMEFGYWVKDSFGKLQYVSLVPHLEQKMRDDEQIWHIIKLNEWVIFQSSNSIYFYNTLQDNFKIISATNTIYNIFKIKDGIYFNVRNEGIYKIVNGEAELIIDDPQIKNERVISAFEVDDQLLLLTQLSGFYKLVGNEVFKWNIPANKLLSKTTVYSALQLQNGDFIIGTISNGIINLHSDGSVNYQINQRNGLSNNTALTLFEDSNSDLWVGLDNGINCINVTSPIKVFNDFNGVLGTVYTSEVYKGYLYIGTNQGLFYKKLDSKDQFQFIQGTEGQVWSLFNYNNEDLLCGHHLGTFVISNKKATLIDDNLGDWTFKKIPSHDNWLLKGNYNGLSILEKTGDKWSVKNKIEGFNSSSRFFELDNENHVWVSHEYKGVYRIQLNDNFTRATEITLEPSLKVGKNSSLVKYRGHILYAYENGIFEYNTKENTFEYDSLLSPMITNEDYVSGKLVVDDKDRLWVFSKENVYFVTTNHLTNKPKLNSISIPLSLRKVTQSFENISRIKDDTYLLGKANGFLTIDLSKINNDTEYTIHLNSISLRDLDNKNTSYDKYEVGDFKYKKGILTFNYSVPSFNKYMQVKYQYKLEGQNNNWSEWKSTASSRFENLGFGSYTFLARAKIGNKLSINTAQYSFRVERPWYLNNIALVIYFVLVLVIAFIINKAYKRHYSKKLQNEQLETEKLISDIKNDQLNKDIESKNRELTLSKMSIIKKNELLNSIKRELKEGDGNKHINSVIKLIDKSLGDTKDWGVFVKAFNNTDKGFLDKIQNLHPDLTPNDLRFCVYLRMNLTSKEIAPLLNISVKSVETKRYRLRKRMKLHHEESLTNYIMRL